MKCNYFDKENKMFYKGLNTQEEMDISNKSVTKIYNFKGVGYSIIDLSFVFHFNVYEIGYDCLNTENDFSYKLFEKRVRFWFNEESTPFIKRCYNEGFDKDKILSILNENIDEFIDSVIISNNKNVEIIEEFDTDYTRDEIIKRIGTTGVIFDEIEKIVLSKEESKKMNKRKQIKIKYLDKNMPKIEKIEKGDWIDLYIDEDILLKAGEHKIISLGVVMKLPEGYEAHLAPRSSTFKKTGLILTNSVGVIDESYCGNDDIWKVDVYATKDIEISKYERLFQFRIMKKQKQVEFIEVDEMEDENRGGYGSTDKKVLCSS